MSRSHVTGSSASADLFGSNLDSAVHGDEEREQRQHRPTHGTRIAVATTVMPYSNVPSLDLRRSFDGDGLLARIRV